MRREIVGKVCGVAANFVCVLPRGSTKVVWIRDINAHRYRVGDRYILSR